MRRRLSLLIALIGVFGLIGLTPAAQADHYTNNSQGKDRNDLTHDAQPVDNLQEALESAAAEAAAGRAGQCVVAGEVSINEGVDATPRHNHYRFNDTEIQCVVSPLGNLPAELNGTFEVDAAGGTDGQGNPTDARHGEDDLQGWSHKSCYVGFNDPGCDDDNAKGSSVADLYDGTHRNGNGNDCWNCGEIAVENLATGAQSCRNNGAVAAACHNVVKFDRVGVAVVAWGELHNTSGIPGVNEVCFLAELEFTPTNFLDGNNEQKPVDEAALVGAAQIWNVDDSPCGVDGDKGKKGGS